MLRGRRTRQHAGRPASPASASGSPEAGASKKAPAPVSPKTIAIRLLARREYGRAELTACLRARGVAPEAIEHALDELTAAGYLSDARFAEALVAGRSGRFSRRAIAYALTEKRVSSDAAQAALAPLATRDEQADAQALWERRFGVPPRDEREKARQVRFLMSRGYSMSIALRVLRAAGSAATPGDDETA